MDELFVPIGFTESTRSGTVVYAGGNRTGIEKRRRSEGIPLHPNVVASLKQLAQELGIEYNL